MSDSATTGRARPPTPELFTQLATAARHTSLAAVHTLAAIGCEHEMDPLTGEQHLELAMSADPDYVQAVDRLAWYASDRGDARKATRTQRSTVRSSRPTAEQAPPDRRHVCSSYSNIHWMNAKRFGTLSCSVA